MANSKDVIFKPKGDHMGKFKLTALGLLFPAVLFFGCAQTPLMGAPLKHSRLKDGTYRGSYGGGLNKAIVAVTIKNQKIVNIVIVEHQAWKGKKAEVPIVEKIIANQSTQVDAVSGATNSSRVIMNAVQKAVEKAY